MKGHRKSEILPLLQHGAGQGAECARVQQLFHLGLVHNRRVDWVNKVGELFDPPKELFA
jgi:hypothetical protein